MISEFQGKHRFLSNFHYFVWPVKKGESHPLTTTVEHLYQAAKTISPWDRNVILGARTPGQAKRLGRQIEIVEDWEERKLDVMLDLLRLKFKDPVLRKLLLGTGNEKLQEGNYWNDEFWGVNLKNGKGKNHLGKLLMKVRAEIRKRRMTSMDKTINATGQLLMLLEDAGKLQAKFNDAKVAYEKSRKKLTNAIEDRGLEGTAIYGSTTWATYRKENFDEIDPNDFLEKVKEKKLRRKCLKVLLGVTKDVFEKDQELLESITSSTTADEPSLKVHKIKPDAA